MELGARGEAIETADSGWSENRFRASRVVGASGRVGARLKFGAHSDRALPLRRERAQNAPLLDILETTVFLAVIPCRDLRRNNRYEGRTTIAGSNRVPRSRRRNCCSDWAFIEGICGGTQPTLSAALATRSVERFAKRKSASRTSSNLLVNPLSNSTCSIARLGWRWLWMRGFGA